MAAPYPILYSFRRCPYAMRARMALLHANITVIIREIQLSNKHAVFLRDSPKGTVPVLMLTDGTILDESMDIVTYAFKHINHPQPNGTHPHTINEHPLCFMLQNTFIKAVTRLKYHERYTQHDIDQAHLTALNFLSELENTLQQQDYLSGNQLGQLDTIVFPFVRQWYRADAQTFMALPYPQTQAWLAHIIASDLFQSIMVKIKPWASNQTTVILQPPPKPKQ